MAYRPLSFPILLYFVIAVNPASAQNVPDFSDGYLTPSEDIAREVLAPRHENVTLSNLNPSGDYFLNTIESGLPSLSAHAKLHFNIAGLQIDPQGNRQRSFTTRTPTTGLEIINSRTGESRKISTPENATITNASWSPNGEQLAYFAHFANSTHIYVADLKSGQSTRITKRPVLATLTTSFEWSGDGESIFTVLIPERRGYEPLPPETPAVLQVRVTSPGKNRLHTYQSLLKDRHEGDRLKYHVTGELTKIDINNGSTTRIGDPAMIRNFDAAPNGDYVIVQTIQNTFSYIVPVNLFGWTEEIWDLEGNILAELRKSETRSGNSDKDALENYGHYDIQWRPDGMGLSLIMEPERYNGGGKLKEIDIENRNNYKSKFRIIQWLPPFRKHDMNIVYTTDRDIRAVSYSNDAEIFFITERKRRIEHLYATFIDEPDSIYTIYTYNRSNFYAYPGSLMQEPGNNGHSVVQLSTDRQHVFLKGTEHYEKFTEHAPRPFIDKVSILDGKTERIFQSSEDVYEQVVAVLDNDLKQIMLERQTPDMLPDSWLYFTEAEDMIRLTSNVDFNAAVTQAFRERIKVTRADGFEFWMEVVMPGDWNGDPLPGLIWQYPTEYRNQRDYNKSLRRYNKNKYPTIDSRSADIMVKKGYAVLKPDWPIAGKSGNSNDYFISSVVENSTAVIDSAANRGFVDRDNMAIGGHSYGAFGASNAMIHTSFFKAGIAGAGNYNRTLTPMGFQRERSDLWKGVDRYMQMSPILWADRLEGALLMYHGEDDQNVGTWPTNSKRMFHALNGLGKEAALYMYPHEAHGPASKETLLDLWTRWSDWLDYYLEKDTTGTEHQNNWSNAPG